MPFTFRAVFGGVYALVPDKELDDKDLKKICILMPNGGSPDRPASGADDLYGRALRRHVPLLTFPLAAAELKSPGSKYDVGVWWLPNHQVRFEFTDPHGNPISPKLSVRYTRSIDEKRVYSKADLERLPAGWPEDLSWVPDLRHIVGAENAQVDPALFDKNYLNSRIAAQVVLEGGELLSARIESDPSSIDSLPVRVTDTLAFPLYRRPLATKMALKVTDLSSVKITATPLPRQDGESPGDPLTLALGAAEGDVDANFLTACHENPLDWEVGDENLDFVEDRDFLWHYRLLSDPAQTDIQGVLTEFRQHLHRPLIPYRFGDRESMGKDNNCIGIRLPPYEDLP